MEEFMKELNEMTLEQVLERKSELEKEIREAQTKEALEGMDSKINAINERVKELKDIEERAKKAEEINAGTVTATVKEERKEKNKMDNINVRESLEYGQAFLRGIKTGDYAEARSLMTVGVDGTVPVPTALDNEIRNAWEEYTLANAVKKTYQKGNVKVVFEVSATGAVIHTEGTAAPDEETLVLGSVELVASNIKKWITVTDEAIEGTTIDTIGYLYKELAQKIVEKAEEDIVSNITSAQSSTDSTHPGVPVLSANPAVDTILNAVALLSGKARNLNIVMNRQTYPAFIKLALEAGYAIDVFDGLKDKIIFTDKLPAYSAASVGNAYAIVGDFGYGYQCNFPNGNDVTIKRDDISLAEKDLVKLVGKQYVGHGVVAPKAFVNIKKVATA